MKKQIIYLTMVTISFLAIFIVGCEKNDIKEVDITPALKTDTIFDVTHSSAVIESTIIDSFKKENITKVGVCWSTESLPTLAHNKTTEPVDSIDVNNFTSTLHGLNLDTHYYVRAYAIYNADTVYGNILSFKTWKPFPENGTEIYDIAGNVYHTLIIGNQVWLNENLKTTRYSNGELILHHTDASWTWKTGAYAEYNDDIDMAGIYGRLYDWYAVNNSKGLCPVGWHVPTEKEFMELSDYLGGESIAGGKLKESGTTHWESPNVDATNASGFTALPSGFRELDGSYHGIGYGVRLWSSTEVNSFGVCLLLSCENSNAIIQNVLHNNVGHPVRCIMDK